MSMLDSIAAPVAPASAHAYETVVAQTADPDDARRTYGVQKRVSDASLHLAVVTQPTDASKDARIKRIPLAPVARALKLGVID